MPGLSDSSPTYGANITHMADKPNLKSQDIHEIHPALMVLCQMMERCTAVNVNSILKLAGRDNVLITDEIKELIETAAQVSFFTGIINGVVNHERNKELADHWVSVPPNDFIALFKALQRMRATDPAVMKDFDEVFNARVAVHDLDKSPPKMDAGGVK